MSGPRGVVYAMLIAFGIFVLAGAQGSRRLENGLARVTGATAREPKPGEPSIGPQALLGWAVLFVIFIALADLDATAELATAFAFLLLLTIVLAFGPDMFNNITRMLGGAPTSSPPSNGKGSTAV
jgi:succinate-acetate transporter protein